METTFFKPDRWLICSDAAYHSIHDHWAQRAGENSLLALRLHRGWIEPVAPNALADRVGDLAADGAHTVLVVFDQVDAAAARQLNALAGLHADALKLRVLAWLDSPLVAVSAMNDPDQQLREVLQADGAGEGVEAALRPTAAAPWWPELNAALLSWEQQARASQGDDFAELYPAYADRPIPWAELAGQVHTTVGAVGSVTESANDWSWVEIQVLSLAADTPKEAFSAMRREPAKESAERWSLSRYPINGQKAVYLMFEAEADSIERYLGCRIQVLAEGKTYELGEVNDDGVAELRLEGTVDISQANVRIGTRKHGG